MSRHTRMTLIEDRLTMLESRIATIEKITQVWFDSLDPGKRQLMIETAQEDDEAPDVR